MAWVNHGSHMSWCVNYRLKLLVQTRKTLLKSAFPKTSYTKQFHTGYLCQQKGRNSKSRNKKWNPDSRQKLGHSNYNSRAKSGSNPVGIPIHWVQRSSSPLGAAQIYTGSPRPVSSKGGQGRGVPTASEVRQRFIQYFEQHDHLHVPSSSIVPRAGEGSYFINAGMNQFKPIFLGTVDPSSKMYQYRRVVNSQRCVRVGGKHNDLEDVGKDTSHHTFFEMLGSWSFGDYFKREACSYAWELLTQQFGIPPAHLYVTYFAGDEQLGLEPDLECRAIWQEIGVPIERIVPSGAADNFWDMGDTGPCGTCTEIHYSRNGSGRVAHLVNRGNSSVMEIWNLVFMQFDRQQDGKLVSLPRHHVDTGMGLERVTAVLQGVGSNYDTDLFTPLFSHIHNHCSCPPYRGQVGAADARGIDTAYRVVADHMRMATVAIAEGLRPGNKDQDGKLRLVLHRALRQARNVLHSPPCFLSTMAPVVIQSLGEAFPKSSFSVSEIMDVINHAELKISQVEKTTIKILDRAVSYYGNTTFLSGGATADCNPTLQSAVAPPGMNLSQTPMSTFSAKVLQMKEGRFGSAVPVDMLEEICRVRGISLDVEEYYRLEEEASKSVHVSLMPDEKRALCLTQQQLFHLKEQGVPASEDYYKYNHEYEEEGYAFRSLEGKIVAILKNGEMTDKVAADDKSGSVHGDHADVIIITDRTCFYAEGGGQAADTGAITTQDGGYLRVNHVQKTADYVLHECQVHKGQFKIGDAVTLSINPEHREQCMKNHTGTHVINYALQSVIGGVCQQGSSVTPHKFTFDFTCSKTTIDDTDLKKVTEVANDLVHDNMTVYKEELPLEYALQLNGIRSLQNEVYPSTVRVVSIGAPSDRLRAQSLNNASATHSVELCGGTHVDNTGDLQALVMTNFKGMSQGTKRITCVTGELALKALDGFTKLKKELNDVHSLIDSDNHADLQDKVRSIEREIGEGALLPKVERDSLQRTLDLIKFNALHQKKNTSLKEKYQQRLEVLLKLHVGDTPLIENFPFTKARDVVAVLADMQPAVPVFLLSSSPAIHTNRPGSNHLYGISYVPEGWREGLTAKQWAQHVATYCHGTHHEPGGKMARRAAGRAHLVASPHPDATLQRAHELALTFINLYQDAALKGEESNREL